MGSFYFFRDGKEFTKSSSIDASKNHIRSSVADQVKNLTLDFQNKLGLLSDINVGLIDEKYRVDAFKDKR